jgi:hypothetical protein
VDFNPDQLSQLGVGGLLITLWTRLLFDYLKEKKNVVVPEARADVREEKNGYKILHDARVETAIAKIVDNLTRQTEILEVLRDDQRDMAQKLDAIKPCRQVGR